MIDRDAQQIHDAEHREQQRITSRLATELAAARAVVEKARRFHQVASGETISFDEYADAEQQLAAALADHDAASAGNPGVEPNSDATSRPPERHGARRTAPAEGQRTPREDSGGSTR